MKHKIYTHALAAINASNEDGVFDNVSLITIGPALGHGVMIDATTLRQVMECGNRFKRGVRVNMSHYSGMEANVGYLDNLHIAGQKLLGTLHLFPEHKDFSLIKTQISTLGDTFGLSLFLDGPNETISGVDYVRCETLFSADIVPTPSANPSGVFSRGNRTESRPSNSKSFMNPLQHTVTEYHKIYRSFRAKGLGQIASLKASQQSDWKAYVAYCRQQEDGVAMESLDEPDHARRMSVIISGGRLV